MTLTETLQPVLDKKIPAALVAAFLLQSAGALFWAGSAAERIATLERDDARTQAAIGEVAAMQAQLTDMKTALTRIENKLDRNK